MSDHSNACKICSLTFECKSLLVRHNSSHHADPVKRPFACNLCDMKFKSNNNLKVSSKFILLALFFFSNEAPVLTYPTNYRPNFTLESFSNLNNNMALGFSV